MISELVFGFVKVFKNFNLRAMNFGKDGIRTSKCTRMAGGVISSLVVDKCWLQNMIFKSELGKLVVHNASFLLCAEFGVVEVEVADGEVRFCC